MKKLLVLTALVLGLVSNVEARPMPTVNSDWSDMSRDSRVYYEFPQFQLSHGYFMRAPSVCVDGDTLRSKKAKKKCVETRGRNDHCVKYEWVLPSKAMEGTRRLCVRWQGGDNDRCVEYRDIPYSIATEYDIKVSRRQNRGDGDVGPGRHLFTKTFTLATCN